MTKYKVYFNNGKDATVRDSDLKLYLDFIGMDKISAIVKEEYAFQR